MEKFKITLDTFQKLNQFVNACEMCGGVVEVKQGRWTVCGSSIVGMMSLDLTKELDAEVDGKYIDTLFENIKGI